MREEPDWSAEEHDWAAEAAYWESHTQEEIDEIRRTWKHVELNTEGAQFFVYRDGELVPLPEEEK